MLFRLALGLSGVMLTSSFIPPIAQNQSPDAQLGRIAGLSLTNQPVRGMGYTDSLGNKYGLRHIPTYITNDSMVPIHVEIAFARSYNTPEAFGEKKFKVFPLPKEWARDGLGPSDTMLTEMPKYIAHPIMSKTIAPGERFVLGLGILTPYPAEYGVFPIAVIPNENEKYYGECVDLIEPEQLPDGQKVFQLCIGFASGSQAYPDGRTTIVAGRISYPEP